MNLLVKITFQFDSGVRLRSVIDTTELDFAVSLTSVSSTQRCH